MSERSHRGNPFTYSMIDYMSDFEDQFAERAKFAGKFAKYPELLKELELSGGYAWTKGTDQWLFEANNYPDAPLDPDVGEEFKTKKRSTRLTGKSVAVRAYVLNKAVGQLLRVIGAPEAMIADLDLILSDFAPRGSKPAERVQRAFIAHPEHADNISQMAKAEDVKTHRTTIQDMMARGIVKKPE